MESGLLTQNAQIRFFNEIALSLKQNIALGTRYK